MKKLYIPVIVALLTLVSLPGHSQNYKNLTTEDFTKHPYWIEMMQDETVNFYDVQKAFNTYWENREITKGSGWKPFKRWEYMMSSRVLPDGTRPAADRDWNEYYQYLQKYPGQKSSDGNWVNLGPYAIPSGKGYKGLGRINAIGFHPTNPQTIFIGAPAGGLWVTTDGGNTWSSETDVLPTLGVSAILVDPTNPDVMYIGTGDRDAGDAPGLGVMKSFDGGHTWAMSNNGMGSRIVGRLLMHPQDHNVIFAATNGGIFKTTDGGDLWVSKKSGDFKEVVFKTNDPSIAFASASGKFYRSTDSGETWGQITSGLPNGERAVIGVSPANPNVVYFLNTAASAYLGLYRSNDAGLNFQEQSTTPNIMSWDCNGGDGGQAWYDLDIAVNPDDANMIFAGGVNCFISTDGGITWQISSHWWGDCSVPSVHADLHVLEYNAADGKLYAGNDGGIYWTSNNGSAWNEITNGLAIGQVYKLGQSATVKDKVINGYQDNGTSTFIGSNNWVNNLGGDGMECAVDIQDAKYSYGTLYYGDIFRLTNNTNGFKVAGVNTFGIDESGGWITPFIMHETVATTMFVGYKNVWRCKNIRTNNPSWTKISYDLGNVNSIDMRVLEQSPANVDILYAAREDKKLFRTDKCNAQSSTWTDLSANLPENTSINDLEAHPTNENIIFMTQGTNVYKSTDKGSSWERITSNLPNVSKNSIAYYKNSNEGLYVATDVGVFYKDAYMSDWILFSNGLPASSRVTEVEIYYDTTNPQNDAIRASTYGRGLWSSDMYHSTPTADFSADHTTVPITCPVTFTDHSPGVPTSWLWTFEGGNPSSSSLPGPIEVVYETPGVFDVTLTITNEFGSDTKSFNNMITVSNDIVPAVSFISDQKVVCTGSSVRFTDLSQYCPLSWHWSFSPDDVVFLDGTSSESQHPLVMFPGNSNYTVSLTVSNINGASTVTEEDYILSGGYKLPFSENFETDNFSSKNWTIENPDGLKTWEIAEPNYTPDGTKTAFINFHDYYKCGERDRLISPPINFEGETNSILTFKYAYAQRFNQKDSLIVYLSDDCGENWNRIYWNGPDGNGIFETALPTSSYFDPATSADWCGEGYGANCVTLPISLTTANARLMFESFNKYGNNLYVDEIAVSTVTGTGNGEIKNQGKDVELFPNPSGGIFTLLFNTSSSSVSIVITDIQGKGLFTRNLRYCENGQNEVFDISAYPEGPYIIHIQGDKIIKTNIILKQ